MQLECEHKDNCQVEFKVVISEGKIAARYEKELNAVLARVELPGFRAGKAPKHMVASRFNQKIQQEIVQKLISEACAEGIKQHDIQPVALPVVDNIQYKDREELSFTALIEVKPRIEFEDYRNIPLIKQVVEVKDEDVEAQLQQLQEEHATLMDVEDNRPAMKGDVAIVDFEYQVDDVKQSKENSLVEIGRDTALPEFEENLIGLRVGENKTFTLAIPENFINPDIAGKDATFTVKMRELKQKQLPAIDDEFAKDMGEYETIDEVKEAIRKGLEAINEERAQEVLKGKIIMDLLSRCVFSLPKTLVKKETAILCEEFIYYLKAQNICPPEDVLNEESLHQRFQPKAETKLKSLLILEHIALRENITVSDEEYKKWIFTNFRGDAGKIREYLNDEEKKDLKTHEMLIEKILNFLIDNADIKVEMVSQLVEEEVA
ncbi:MAG: trigger factor [bacterium]|nr:trigger factor [bacterium]